MSRRDERFGGLRRGGDEIENEVDAEIAHHLDLRAARRREEGMSPTDAAAEARRRFGGVAEVREECLQLQARNERRAARRDLLGDVGRDLRLAARRLRREPGFALAAVCTLGLGLGALLAVLSLFDAVMLRPLGFADADRLVAVWPESRSLAELEAVEGLDSLDTVAGYRDDIQLALPGPDMPLRVDAAQVTPSLFRVFGRTPLLGRLLTAEDTAPGLRRALIGERLWRRIWDADPTVVGSEVQLDGRGWEVVGVLPAAFRFPQADTEVWLPLDRDDSNLGAFWGNYDVRLVGKLAADSTLHRVALDLRTLADRLRAENPIWTPDETYGRDAQAVPLQRQLAGSDLRLLLVVLLGAVAALMLIVCVNVAGLLIARAGARMQEAALRSSLGASRARLVTQHLVESLALALGGTLVGVLVAQSLVVLLAAGLEGVDARFGAIGLDGRLLLFATGLLVLTAGSIGLWPALRISRAPHSLLPGRGTTGRERSRNDAGRRALVAVQIAACVLLVSGATLLLLSFWKLSRVDPGFEGDAVLSAQLDPPAASYADPARVLELYDRLLERLAATPGVRAVATASRLPLDGAQARMAFPASGQPRSEGGNLPMAVRRVVSSGYFDTLGIPLLAGRLFDQTDRGDAQRVAMVNRTLAETIWPGRSAVGERVGMPWEQSPEILVVGVVEDVLQDRLDAPVEPEIYLPFTQSPTPRMGDWQASQVLLVRAAVDPSTLGATIRSEVAALDGRIPASDIATVRAITLDSISNARHLALTIAALATLALVIAAVGVFGVIAYLVEERRREIGVRVALGATSSGVARLFLRQGLALGTVGTVAGLLATAVFGRTVRAFLFEASPLDPAVLVSVSLALLGVCLLASWLPARRAATLDPVEALRSD